MSTASHYLQVHKALLEHSKLGVVRVLAIQGIRLGIEREERLVGIGQASTGGEQEPTKIALGLQDSLAPSSSVSSSKENIS